MDLLSPASILILTMKMSGLKVVLLVLGIAMFAVPCSHGVSVACMAVYDEGHAPAVFRSSECHDWVLSAKAHQSETMNCQFETTRGRRRYQEDRISCNLDMQIPLLGGTGPEDLRVGVVAVFDGHIGKEASDMASKLVLDFIFLHSVFGSFKNWLSLKEEQNLAFQYGNEDVELESHKSTIERVEGTSLVILDGSTRMGLLKDALVKTIKDIDSAFTEAAFENNLAAGSTAVVALMVDGQILVANVGDSKALLCSEKLPPHQEADGACASIPDLSVKELTIDHNPHRDEERARIEAAGGIISWYDTPVINGHFPMTRALGDIPLKRYGIISDPEVTDWQPLTANDSYLVVASDGIFESLKPQKVCNLIRDAHFQDTKKSKKSDSCLALSSLANCIVRNAFEKGSTDNLSVVVVPLRSAGFSPVKS